MPPRLRGTARINLSDLFSCPWLHEAMHDRDHFRYHSLGYSVSSGQYYTACSTRTTVHRPLELAREILQINKCNSPIVILWCINITSTNHVQALTKVLLPMSTNGESTTCNLNVQTCRWRSDLNILSFDRTKETDDNFWCLIIGYLDGVP